MRLCLETIAEACGSGIPADAKSTVVTSVVTDSRRAVPGSLFVCIPGERVDGHDFAVKALKTEPAPCWRSVPFRNSPPGILRCPCSWWTIR